MLTRLNHKQGFTLVEIMVAVSIFSIVTIIVTGALITAIAINNKAQAIKLAMDNLNYALDSITIKMKHGQSFSTASNGTVLSFSSPKGASLGPPINYIYNLETDSSNRQYLAMSKDSGPSTRLTASALDIRNFKVFVNTGANFKRAVIAIQGSAIVGNQEQKFAVQTTVTER